LLVEMDGFEANEGRDPDRATKRPDVLDPALLRPGRFDRQVVVPNSGCRRPRTRSSGARPASAVAPDINLKTIARGTPGFFGSDLMNLSTSAALDGGPAA